VNQRNPDQYNPKNQCSDDYQSCQTRSLSPSNLASISSSVHPYFS
jgi:hypothetical protein